MPGQLQPFSPQTSSYLSFAGQSARELQRKAIRAMGIMIYPDYQVAEARDEHQPWIQELSETLFRSDIETIWGWDEAWQLENFTREWQSCETWLITVGDEPAGYFQVVVKPDHLYLLGIGLVLPFQRRGIGTGIVRQLQERARREELPLRLSVFRTQLWRLDYYRRLGFTETRREEAFHRMEWLPGAPELKENLSGLS